MKTIKKVMIVVPVLITNCQVSEKLNIGPVTAHTIITKNAMINDVDVPTARVIADDIFSNRAVKLVFLFDIFYFKVKEKVRPISLTFPDPRIPVFVSMRAYLIGAISFFESISKSSVSDCTAL